MMDPRLGDEERRKMKEKNHYYLRDTKLLDF